MTGPRRIPALPRLAAIRRRGLGPWRIAVVEASMLPAIESGDWLLVDPTVARWPRRGSVVVFREPGTGDLAIKRVAARPGDWIPFADGWLQLAEDEAWLVGDATDEALQGAGFGPAVDSRRYGPVPVEALVARAWFRYGPVRRIGRLAPPPADLLERGREGRIPVPSPADADGPVAPPAGGLLP
jgi:signal peptidase I